MAGTPRKRINAASGGRDTPLASIRKDARDIEDSVLAWVRSMFTAQRADIRAYIEEIGRYRTLAGSTLAEERTTAEEMKSHLRVLADSIDAREQAITSALRLREQATIAGDTDPESRARSASTLSRLQPRPLSLPSADSTGTSKGNASGLG